MVAALSNWLRPGLNYELLKKWSGLLIGSLIVLSACIYQGYFKQINHVFFDAVMVFKEAPVDRRIVIVSIDERTMKDLGSWPLPRDYFVNFIRQLVATHNQPAGIGFDLVFSEPDPSDGVFTNQLLSLDAHVAANMQLPKKLKNGKSGSMDKLVATTDGQRVPQEVAISDARILSHVNFALGGDGIFRGVRMYDSSVPHLGLSVSGLSNNYPSSSEDLSRFPIIKNLSSFKTISFIDTFEPVRTDFSIFKDAYVLVGITAESLGDRYPSSYMGKKMIDTPRVLFTASVLNALLQKQLITVVSVNLQILITALVVILALLIFVTVPPSLELATTSALFFVVAIGSWLLLLYLNYWIDPTPSLLALPTIKAVWSWMQLKSTLEFIEQKSSSLNFEVATHLDNQLPVVKTLALLDRAILETSSRFNNLTLVMNALPDPVFAIDKAGQIVFANWAFDIFFSDGQAIKPLTIKDLISRFNFPPDSFNHSSSTSSTVRAVRLTADGVIKHFIPRSVMISWSGSERLHLYTCVDVTAVMTLQAQRDKTLQLLSHDMRSPLAGILLVCEQITSFDPLDTARITKFAQRALAMMDSFILAIKADSEQYEYADHVFDSILEQALYETRARAHKYNVSWVLKQDQLLYVNCDSRLIERVLVNIFNNAIRHSPPGGCVDIHIIKQDREHGPFLICTVKNFISTDDAGIAVDLHHKSYKLGYEFIEQVVRRHCGTVTKNFDTEHQQAVVEMALPCLAS